MSTRALTSPRGRLRPPKLEVKEPMTNTDRARELIRSLKRLTHQAALELNRQSTTDSRPPIRAVLRNVFAHAYLMGLEDGFTGKREPLPLEELLRELELNDFVAAEIERARRGKKAEDEDTETLLRKQGA